MDEQFDDADGSIRIVDADWFSDDLRLSISVRWNDGSQPELWDVSCVGVVEESLRSEWVSNLNVIGDSPLFKPYAELEVDLIFSENECQPALLLGVVASCCMETMERPEYIRRFLNQRPTVSGIVSSRYGLLGRFPETVGARIVAALIGQPIRINSLAVSVPKRWTGTEFIPYPKLQVLAVGESYVIAESFSAVRAYESGGRSLIYDDNPKSKI